MTIVLSLKNHALEAQVKKTPYSQEGKDEMQHPLEMTKLLKPDNDISGKGL